MNKIILRILVLAVILGGAVFIAKNKTPAVDYNPTINPADFTTQIDNRYFKLPIGRKMIYEAMTAEGKERIEVLVTNEKKQVMGVDTVVVWDRVWLNDELIEDTRDWYAQDAEGNVWYFGEDTAELENGVVINHNGAWEGGVDGAKPGIVMKANPQVGDSYRLEYYAGEAEDMADVLFLNESVTVPFRTFANCLKTFDYTPLDLRAKEYKYYCPEAGGVVLETNMDNTERMELVKVE